MNRLRLGRGSYCENIENIQNNEISTVVWSIVSDHNTRGVKFWTIAKPFNKERLMLSQCNISLLIVKKYQ